MDKLNFKSIIKYDFFVASVFCYILNLSFLFIFLLTIFNFYFHSNAHAAPQSASSVVKENAALDSNCNKKPSNPKDKPREFGELRETFKEWDYYIGNDGCWIVTSSISKRIDTLNPVPSCLNGSSLAITNHIGEKSLEVSIGADFLLEEDVLVSLFLGQRKYPFFTEDDYAWPKSREDEPRIVNDLKNIQIGVVEFYRSEEKNRIEIFSSAGFTEAYKAINSQCPFKQYVYK